jgi:hypothetical protein
MSKVQNRFLTPFCLSKITDLVDMLAMNFDIVDGNIGADDGNRYYSRDSLGGKKAFAFL